MIYRSCVLRSKMLESHLVQRCIVARFSIVAPCAKICVIVLLERIISLGKEGTVTVLSIVHDDGMTGNCRTDCFEIISLYRGILTNFVDII